MPERDRAALVQRDEAEGFVLTGYFYDQLRQFEKAGLGLQDAFPNWLHDIDVQQQKKRASQITYSTEATPDVVQSSQPASQKRIDMEGAQANFQKAVDSGKDPHVVAWSHIYLGRIYDIQGERDDAVAQYKAALAIGDVPPDAKAAAEHGLQQAYQPPRAKEKQDED